MHGNLPDKSVRHESSDSITVRTSTKDVVWGYISTILAPISGFILLPFLLLFLTDAEVGLWYVYIAISGWPSLLYLGLSPAFSRNIVYCLSGAKELSKSGEVEYTRGAPINWHLLRSVMTTSRLFYSLIACVTLLLLASIGTLYVTSVTQSSGIPSTERDIAWAVFCIAMTLEVYFQYTDIFLRGFGDIAATSKARVFAKLLQLLVTPILLFAGLSLIGAAFGFLANSLAYRFLSAVYVRGHVAVQYGINSDSLPVKIKEVTETFLTIFYIAWRDGIVMIAMYFATQVSTLLCSAFLSLEEAGAYALLLQFANAVFNFASSYASSSFPEFQSAYAVKDLSRQVQIAGNCTFAYWGVSLVCTLGVTFVALPILSLIQPSYAYDPTLYIAITIYLALLNHHSMYCSLIMCMNEIPYAASYLVSSAAGLALAAVLMSVVNLGPWGLVIGQALAQAVYNNWYWPLYVTKRLGTTYRQVLQAGCSAFRRRIDNWRAKPTGR